MTTRRLATVTVLLAAVLAMGAEVAKAQERTLIASRQVIPTNRDFAVLISGNSSEVVSFSEGTCAADLGFTGTYHSSPAVLVMTGEVTYTIDWLITLTSLPPGTRLEDFNLVGHCLNEDVSIYDVEVLSPEARTVAFVIAPAGNTLTEDHEAVVGAGADPDGIADAVCVKQGSPTIKTAILSDIPLEAGDRLTGFVELDFDPETGETLYGCWVEY